MNKINTSSRRLRWIFQLLAILLPIAAIGFWCLPLDSIREYMANAEGFLGTTLFTPYNIHTEALPWDSRVLAFLASLLSIGFIEAILLALVKLFRSYEQGQIFTRKTAGMIRLIGYLLLIKTLFSPIYQALMTLILSFHNPVGQRYIGISLFGTDLGMVLVAFVIIFVAQIMLQASRLQEDQSLTI